MVIAKNGRVGNRLKCKWYVFSKTFKSVITHVYGSLFPMAPEPLNVVKFTVKFRVIKSKMREVPTACNELFNCTLLHLKVRLNRE